MVTAFGRRTIGGSLAVLGIALFLGGCASPSGVTQRVSRYMPSVDDRKPWLWATEQEGTGEAPTEVPTSTPRAADGVSSGAGTADVPAKGGRPLKRGDRLAVYLRGIQTPEDILEVVDDRGEITLPLIGTRRVEGLTSSQAEERLVRAYVDEGYYKEGKINVILVAQEEEYFLRGEVKRPGRYPLSGDLTLLQAITAAGGYTDYAKRSRIRIIRGEDVKTYDADRIELRKDEDPLIMPGDIIIVTARIFF